MHFWHKEYDIHPKVGGFNSFLLTLSLLYSLLFTRLNKEKLKRGECL